MSDDSQTSEGQEAVTEEAVTNMIQLLGNNLSKNERRAAWGLNGISTVILVVLTVVVIPYTESQKKGTEAIVEITTQVAEIAKSQQKFALSQQDLILRLDEHLLQFDHPKGIINMLESMVDGTTFTDQQLAFLLALDEEHPDLRLMDIFAKVSDFHRMNPNSLKAQLKNNLKK